MTEQSQQPEQSQQQEPAMKSAASPAAAPPSAVPLATTPNQILQTALTWITITWVRLRPTTIAGLRAIATQAQQWVKALETQEETAVKMGETVAPIDWTPIVNLGDRFWRTVKPFWEKIMAVARPRLPESFQPLSDRALSGIFAGTLLLILWFFSAISPSVQATPPPESLSEPVSERRSPNARTFSQRPPSPTPRTFDSQPRPIEDLSSPSQTAPVQNITPIPSPQITKPPEVLNPEASRRLQLRQNLDLIANALVDQAIVGIRPNDRSQSLTITLSDAWYRSSEDLQTKLTNSLLVIAQGQGYSRLQLEDTEGTIVARNAVVGEGMLVVQRSR